MNEEEATQKFEAGKEGVIQLLLKKQKISLKFRKGQQILCSHPMFRTRFNWVNDQIQPSQNGCQEKGKKLRNVLIFYGLAASPRAYLLF